MVNAMNFYFSARLIELKRFFVFWLVKKARIMSGLSVSNTKLLSNIKYICLFQSGF